MAAHWDHVYQGSSEVLSWSEPSSLSSLENVKRAYRLMKLDLNTGSFIDVGGGTADLAKLLLEAGAEKVAVLDLSPQALEQSKARLGLQTALKVNYIVGDVTKISLSYGIYDIWHDRALFHFMVTPDMMNSYVRSCARAVREGGIAIIGCFSLIGPRSCSGIDVHRHSAESLSELFGPYFSLLSAEPFIHTTPLGDKQDFIIAFFQRNSNFLSDFPKQPLEPSQEKKPLSSGGVLGSWPAAHRGRVSMRFDFAHLFKHTSKDTDRFDLWLPYPVSDEFQRISDVTFSGDYQSFGIYTDRVFKNPILYASWKRTEAATERAYWLDFNFTVARSSILRQDKIPTNEVDAPWSPSTFSLDLSSTSLAKLEGEVLATANQAALGAGTTVEKAHKVYQWVIANMHRDTSIIGCGDGDVCSLLSRGKAATSIGGKCTDMGSMFVALCRAVGVPSRERFGIRLCKNDDECAIAQMQHCWVEFFAPGFGWASADPADVRLKMLAENLDLHDEKTEEYKRAYWGGLDSYRMALSVGRDIILEPPQQGPPLNTFGYPYGELNGIVVDGKRPDDFRYVFRFTKLS